MIDHWVDKYEGDPEFEFDVLAIEVGKRIVERMDHLGMTRTALAEELQVSKARISQVLSGHDNLTLKTIVAVAAGLGCRVDFQLKRTRSAQSLRWHPVELLAFSETTDEGADFASAA